MNVPNFELAIRNKVRFALPNGVASVEDLWDLPLSSTNKPNLDDIARGLNKMLRESDSDVSFVRPASSTTDGLQLKFDIVKYIIEVKMAERDAQAEKMRKAAKKQQLMEIMSRKQDAALENMSLEDLQKMISEL